MEKKRLKKLILKKETIGILNFAQQEEIHGGGTTSFNYDNNTCGKTNFTCCGGGSWSIPKSCCGGCGSTETIPCASKACNTNYLC